MSAPVPEYVPPPLSPDELADIIESAAIKVRSVRIVLTDSRPMLAAHVKEAESELFTLVLELRLGRPVGEATA